MIAADVRATIELFEASDLTELAIERGGRRLVLRKDDGAAAEAAAAPPAAAAEPARPEPVAAKAHMVGLFYWARDKSPEAPVRLHQRVDKGQVVGFVEAMDIMNEVEAPAAGSVVEVLASNGQPVEYGQLLLIIEV